MKDFLRTGELPLPPHYDPSRVNQIWKVDYQERARDAARWAERHDLSPAGSDGPRLGLLLIDVQNTFCHPDFELFVAGRSGEGAVSDSRRSTEFIYRNLHRISDIHATMDTHTAAQIFHPLFLVDPRGRHPEPMTTITLDDLRSGRYRVNPRLAEHFPETDLDALEGHLLHYCERLEVTGKYELMIWPYHAMLGGIGHALVSAIEEALFFHSIARDCRTHFHIKGRNPRTENYSVLAPEVMTDASGSTIAEKDGGLVERLLAYDALIIAGQAKSHCVSWTVADLLLEIEARDARLARKIYLLEDCTSPVVVPGVVDFSDAADGAFERYARAGMRRVHSSEPMEAWPGFRTEGSSTTIGTAAAGESS